VPGFTDTVIDPSGKSHRVAFDVDARVNVGVTIAVLTTTSAVEEHLVVLSVALTV
jgi:hypothetical protein